MKTFLSKVTTQVLSKNEDISNITFVLPSKRAGLFLKTEITKQLKKPSILPKILSVETFIKNISGIDLIENIALIFEFYKIYIKHSKKEKIDSFDVFSKWANILLQDFNEIDSNLVDAKNILSYVNDSKRLENWNLQDNKQTPLTKNYLNFFDKIKIYYSSLYAHLLNKNLGYQGILYRKAFENTELYIKQNSNNTKYIFAGFNALNKAEENIFHIFLLNNKAEIYWDTDEFYFKNNNEIGKYFKLYKNNWNHYFSHKFNWIENNLNTPKNIFIYGVPKNITQIKKAGDILHQIKNKKKNLQNTAIILGNEKLLPVLLNSIPKEIGSANITMGYSLQNIPLSNLFELIFKLHINKKKFDKNSFYHKDFLSLLNHPILHILWNNNKGFKTKLNTLIIKNKTIFISQNDIYNLLNSENNLKIIFTILFVNWGKNIDSILNNFLSAIDILRNNDSLNYLEKEYLFRFNNIFQQLINLNNEFGFIKDIKTLYQFYKQILRTENLPFQGEPLQGLQIMGMLESRVLDFENVIITSVNEGFLPSGNTQNSFIPLDIKIEKGLPTYQEKDTIFAYHFYRLLHRAKNVYLLYNTETDDFGSGEQSRFITQLEIAQENNSLGELIITKNIVIPKLKLSSILLKEIHKSESIINQLKEIAKKGFSPSSLSLYIRNPIEFYKKKILKLKELEEVEETIAANTFGTIIHETLKELYLPFINTFITKEDIIEMKKKSIDEISNQFEKYYSLKSISSGKNYLTFEISKQFILNFLNYELEELKKNKKIKILKIEEELEVNYILNEFPFPIKLKGIVDRIDEVDGVIRIIDYKTGKVQWGNLKIKDWDLLSSDFNYSKSFQVLFYAFLYTQSNNLNLEEFNIESGIISFKNLRLGFMKVNNSVISQNDIDKFLLQLNKLIIEIYNPKILFIEKET